MVHDGCRRLLPGPRHEAPEAAEACRGLAVPLRWTYDSSWKEATDDSFPT